MYTTLTHRTLVVAILLTVGAMPAWVGPAWAGPADDQYTVAAGYYSQGRWQLAADEFRSLLRQFPQHERADTAAFFLAEALVQLGQYDEAHTTFHNFLQRSPEHRYAQQALFRTGESAFLSGKRDEARRNLEQFLQRYPQDPACAFALPYLGEIALDGGDTQRAQSLYREALQSFPNGPMADQCRFGMARTSQLLGNDADAHRFYQFLADNPRGELADDAQLQRAILYYNRHQYDQAATMLGTFESTFLRSELRIAARYWLGMSQVAQRKWDAAAETLTKIAGVESSDPLAPAIVFSAAEALRHSGRLDEAALHYDRVLKDWPVGQWADDSLQARIQIAFNLGQHERVDGLAAEFDTRFRDSPLRPHVRQAVGRSLLKREQFESAITAFRETTQQPAADAAADRTNRYYLALACLGAQRYQDVLDALDALDKMPSAQQQPELIDGVNVARASALIGLKRFDEAIVPLQAYLKSQPNGPDATKCRAQLTAALAETGKFEEAEDVLAELGRLDADQNVYLSTTRYLADTALARNQTELAQRLFKLLARDGNPPDDVAKGLSGLAWIQLNTNKPAQSAETFERLLEQFPDSPEAADAALMRAKALERLQQFDAALAMYHTFVEKNPNAKQSPHALFGAARLHDQLEQDQEAATLLQRLIEKYPQFEQMDAVLYQLAWVLVDLKRADDADAIFKRVAGEHRESRFWADSMYRLAERAAKAQEYDEARRLAGELVDSKCDGQILSHALYLQGQLAATEQKWQDVAKPMQRLVGEFRDSPLRLPAEYWIAESLYRQADYEQAGERFADLAVKTGGRNDTWLAMVPLRRAQVLAHEEQWPEAYELVAGIAAQFPEFRQQYEADYLLGRCLSSQARFDDARAAYERVIRSPTGGRTETAAMAQWMVGESYLHQRNYDEAIKAYHRVERLYAYPRWQAAALLQAGKCYEAKGDWKQAVNLYAQLLKDYPNTTFTEEASGRLRDARDRTVPITTSSNN
jgi:TolA-binding protein